MVHCILQNTFLQLHFQNGHFSNSTKYSAVSGNLHGIQALLEESAGGLAPEIVKSEIDQEGGIHLDSLLLGFLLIAPRERAIARINACVIESGLLPSPSRFFVSFPLP